MRRARFLKRQKQIPRRPALAGLHGMTGTGGRNDGERAGLQQIEGPPLSRAGREERDICATRATRSDMFVYEVSCLTMRLHIIQHVAFEGPGAIGEWARERGHSMTVTEQSRGGQLPGLESFDFLVIMGGPMSANDDGRFAWLAEEKKLIAEALRGQKAILGVCLGAQLVAQALGARVYRNREKEIGWFPVRLTPEAAGSRLFTGLPAAMTVLHWHGETFDLPQGAVRLAESDLCRNQAFEFDGRVLGLQFHLEVLPEGLEDLIQHSAEDLERGPAVQTGGELRASAHLSRTLQPALYTILDRLAEAVAGKP